MEQVFDIGPIINLNIIDEKLAILANLNYDTEYLEVGYYFLCDLMIINLPEDELVAGLIKYINALVDHNLPLDLAKEMITYFGFKLVRLEHSISKPVAKHASNRFLPLEMAFGEQLSMVRQHLASVYELKGKWEKAIQALKSIELETGIHGQYSSNYKLGTYLRLSRFYLEIHNGEEAESYINRAGYTLVDAEDESLHTDFKVGCARVLDFQQKFIDAAQHYHDLATCESISQEFSYAALRNAITCTMLSSPGKQRSGLIASFCNDRRTRTMEIYSVLLKIYRGLHVYPSELVVFEMKLKPHQKMLFAHNCTFLKLALVQHNLIAASNMYKNISFTMLAEILEIDAERVQRIARQMISEDILNGDIDLSECVLNFEIDVEVLS